MIHTVIHIIGWVGVCALAMFAFCAMLLVLYVAVARVSGAMVNIAGGWIVGQRNRRSQWALWFVVVYARLKHRNVPYRKGLRNIWRWRQYQERLLTQ